MEGTVTRDSCSDGIQLCVSKAIGRFRTALNPDFQLAPTRIRRFIHFPWDLSVSIIALSGDGLVSVPLPGLSPDILYRCSCVRSGGETFLRPEGPSAVQPLSHSAYQPAYISYIYIFFGICSEMTLREFWQRVKLFTCLQISLYKHKVYIDIVILHILYKFAYLSAINVNIYLSVIRNSKKKLSLL